MCVSGELNDVAVVDVMSGRPTAPRRLAQYPVHSSIRRTPIRLNSIGRRFDRIGECLHDKQLHRMSMLQLIASWVVRSVDGPRIDTYAVVSVRLVATNVLTVRLISSAKCARRQINNLNIRSCGRSRMPPPGQPCGNSLPNQ